VTNRTTGVPRARLVMAALACRGRKILPRCTKPQARKHSVLPVPCRCLQSLLLLNEREALIICRIRLSGLRDSAGLVHNYCRNPGRQPVQDVESFPSLMPIDPLGAWCYVGDYSTKSRCAVDCTTSGKHVLSYTYVDMSPHSPRSVYWSRHIGCPSRSNCRMLSSRVR